MPDDRNDVSGLKELLDLAETTGAAFHMVHIVSTGLGRVPTFLSIGRATFAGGNQFSQGIVHVLVGGTLVVRDEELVKGVYAGKPVRGGVKPGT
jgi:hypothetical protein